MAGQGLSRDGYCGNCLMQGEYVPLDRVGIFERCSQCGFSRVMGTADRSEAGQYIRTVDGVKPVESETPDTGYSV